MILSIFALSQDGWEWAPIGAQWTYQSRDQFGTYLHFIDVSIDTIIEGQQCKILEYSSSWTDCDGVQDSRVFMYYQNHQVFWYYNNNFELVYDFNLTKDDSLMWQSFKVFCDEGVPDYHVIDSSYFHQGNGQISFKVYLVSNGFVQGFSYFHELFLSSANPLPTEIFLDAGLYVTLQCYSDDRFTVNMDYSGTDPVAIFSDKCDFIVATEDLEEKNLRPKIFPTITRDYIEIDSRTPIKGYMLYGIGGQLIDYQEFDSKTGNTSIDISLLSSGVHFLRLIDSEGRQFIEKIMKL